MSDHRHFQSDTRHDVPCANVRDDLHAWALGALESVEREQIDHHLTGCPGCRAEADRWAQVTTTLPLSLAPTSPSSELKQHVMQRIAADQMRHVPVPVPSKRSAPGANRPVAPSSTPRLATWSQVLIAPLIVALIAMSSWAFSLRDQVDTLEGGNIEVTSSGETMLPDGVQTFSMKTECPKCTAAGRLLANPHTANALFVAWNLDPSMVHQVWCVDDKGSRTMVANLKVNSSGDVVQPLLFDDPIAGYSEIYVMSKDDGEEQMMEMDETPMSTPPPDPDEQRR